MTRILFRSTTVVAVLSFAVAATVQAAVTKLDPSGFQLVGQTDYYQSIIDKLDDALPKVSVPDVLADTNHATPGYSGPSNFIQDFTWEDVSGYDDQNTEKWYPQGITTSSDAYDIGTYQGKNVILVSWYDHRDVPTADSKGVRISFIDADKKAYRNVLLVVPSTESDGTATFSSVKIHAGGIFWYGNILYVVDTSNGLRLFDLNHIYRVDTGDNIGHVGNGVYQAFTYKYVIPQLGLYKAQGSVGDGFRFSYCALDRTTTPDSMIVGEYDSTGASNRIARFNLDYTTRFLRYSSGSTAVATELYNMGLKSVQGALSVNGTYYFSCSRGTSTKGDLYTWKGEGTEPVAHTGVMSIGCEDLSYRKQGDQLWSLGEHPGTRPVYALKSSSYK